MLIPEAEIYRSFQPLRRTLVGGETGLADTAGGETGLVDTAGGETGLVNTGDSADASGTIGTGATGEGGAADSGVPFCVLAAWAGEASPSPDCGESETSMTS